MATPLDVLLRDLASAVSRGDQDAQRAVRETIVAQHADTEAGFDAAYRLGLESLLRDRSLDAAAERLRAAARSKDPVLGPAARVSLGLVLARLGKPQQALFELRKAASGRPAGLLQVQALGFVETLLREQKNGAEADRVRAELRKLIDAVRKSGAPEDAAMAELLLGAELKSEGKRELARTHLRAAIDSGRLSPDARARAEQLLRDVS